MPSPHSLCGDAGFHTKQLPEGKTFRSIANCAVWCSQGQTWQPEDQTEPTAGSSHNNDPSQVTTRLPLRPQSAKLEQQQS